MILAAIAALDEKNGSNKKSISKYIESKYRDLPAGATTLFSHHLNRMKSAGELLFWKNNYMKADTNAPPRRGRGRPPKPKVPLPPGTVVSPARHRAVHQRTKMHPQSLHLLEVESQEGGQEK